MSGNVAISAFLFLFLLSGIGGASFAQEKEYHHQVEATLYLDETSEVPIPLLEKMEVWRSQPIDLNLASREELYDSGLFTPFQVEVLLRYRERYGPLFSIYELASLSGFRRSRLQEISTCIRVGTRIAAVNLKRKEGWILWEGSTSLPLPEAFLKNDTIQPPSVFPGDPLRMKGRIRVEPSRYLTLGVAYEKDPGELFFTRMRPEFIAGFITYRGTRRIKHLMAGTFRVHHGLGLVNGTGLIHSLGIHSLQPLSAPTLSPSVSLSESRYEQGLACQLKLGKVTMICWISYAPFDLSLNQFQPTEIPLDWEEMERTSGYHRTTTEINGQSLAFRFHQGTLASWRNQHWRVEAMAGIRTNGLTRRGKDSLDMDPGRSVYPTGSLYGGWFGDHLQLSGELAANTSGALALQAMAGYRFSDFLSGLLLIHHYGSGFRGMFPSSYGAGSQVRNDQGVAWSLHLETDHVVVADCSIEVFRFPAPGHLASLPSLSYKYSCDLHNSGRKSHSWSVRAWKRGWQHSVQPEVPGAAPLEWSEVTRLDFQYRHTAGTQFQWNSRLIISWYSESAGEDPGYAAAQQLTWSPFNFLKVTLQMVHFRIIEWENRIYLHEPGLLYQFQFPVCYGHGEKIASVFTLKGGRHFTISWKIATLIKNAETSSLLVGQVVSWRRKWDLALQMRLRL